MIGISQKKLPQPNVRRIVRMVDIMGSKLGITTFALTVFLRFAAGDISTLRVAVCSEGYPPYVIKQGSKYVGFELGRCHLI
jgi:hypothetical protein